MKKRERSPQRAGGWEEKDKLKQGGGESNAIEKRNMIICVTNLSELAHFPSLNILL